MSISIRIKQRRNELGLTQAELALKVGVSQQSIQTIEKGKVKKPTNIVEIAKALNCSAEWLCYGSSPVNAA